MLCDYITCECNICDQYVTCVTSHHILCLSPKSKINKNQVYYSQLQYREAYKSIFGQF